MQSEQKSYPSFDLEKSVNRAKWFLEDLEKGTGWSQAYKAPAFDSWIKTFPEEHVPVKVVYMMRDMPLSAEKFAEMMGPANMEFRREWDKAFTDYEVLEVFPDGGRIVFARVKLRCPLSDRCFLLYSSPIKEIDWLGKRAFSLFVQNATHASKAIGHDNGAVRATNGGNFYIAIADEKEPQTKCNVFGLTNNNYNGWLPNTGIEWLASRVVPKVFHTLQKSVIQGYEKFFMEEEHEI